MQCDKFPNSEVELCCIVSMNAPIGSHDPALNILCCSANHSYCDESRHVTSLQFANTERTDALEDKIVKKAAESFMTVDDILVMCCSLCYFTY